MERKNKRAQWGKGPVIEKIAIRPEQAVLACCSNDDAVGARFWSTYLTGPTHACRYGAGSGLSCASSPVGKGNCTTGQQRGNEVASSASS